MGPQTSGTDVDSHVSSMTSLLEALAERIDEYLRVTRISIVCEKLPLRPLWLCPEYRDIACYCKLCKKGSAGVRGSTRRSLKIVSLCAEVTYVRVSPLFCLVSLA